MKNLKAKVSKPAIVKKPKAKAKVKIAAIVKKDPIVKEIPEIKESCACDCGHESPRFGKIFLGLTLVLLGLFYLGKNLGFFPEINFNFQIIWPVLFILVGLFLVNRRSRISIFVGIFSALVLMLILTFIVNFSQVKNDYGLEPIVTTIPHIEEPQSTTTPIQTGDIKLIDFIADATISSPLSIEGSARGTWFFEGSFPVKVLGENGVELGRGIAQAQGSWMTEDFVPFKASIVFTRPTSSTGSLVLMKDNPSGLVENDQQVVLPVKF